MIEYIGKSETGAWVVVFWTRDETPANVDGGADLDGWYLEWNVGGSVYFGYRITVFISRGSTVPALYDEADVNEIDLPVTTLPIPLADQLILEAMVRRLPAAKRVTPGKLQRRVVEL